MTVATKLMYYLKAIGKCTAFSVKTFLIFYLVVTIPAGTILFLINGSLEVFGFAGMLLLISVVAMMVPLIIVLSFVRISGIAPRFFKQPRRLNTFAYVSYVLQIASVFVSLTVEGIWEEILIGVLIDAVWFFVYRSICDHFE